MPTSFCFYMDDSGSRDPDRDSGNSERPVDWFGLGGVLIREDHKAGAEASIASFRARWSQIGDAPLHSYDIRNRKKNFRWLASDKGLEERFRDDISALIVELPIHVMACVVHRPGYNTRYLEKYGPRRWQLCKTAFTISLDRATKFARHHNARLKVFIERSDKQTEAELRGYYDALRVDGLPFDKEASSRYTPLQSGQFKETLYDFKVKTKASYLMQIADLVLWPTCVGGYPSPNPALDILRKHGKLLDAHCTAENGLHGIKYSCFDLAST